MRLVAGELRREIAAPRPLRARPQIGEAMTDVARSITEAAFIDAPRDPQVKALYDYWNALRGDRAMPARADVDPATIPKLLPHIIMYDVAAEGGYSIRLVGEEVVRFVGRNATGGPAGTVMPPRAAEMMINILDAVTAERVPKFRAGKAHWQPDKDYRDFEACFLPLSADGETVNIVLGGVSFPN
jgi:hypothetical protein